MTINTNLCSHCINQACIVLKRPAEFKGLKTAVCHSHIDGLYIPSDDDLPTAEDIYNENNPPENLCISCWNQGCPNYTAIKAGITDPPVVYNCPAHMERAEECPPCIPGSGVCAPNMAGLTNQAGHIHDILLNKVSDLKELTTSVIDQKVELRNLLEDLLSTVTKAPCDADMSAILAKWILTNMRKLGKHNLVM